MKTKPKWDIVKTLNELKSGIERPGYNSARRSELTVSIEKNLDAHSLDGLLRVAIALEHLGTVEGARGVVGVWQEELDGWKYLQTCLGSLGWNVRIYTGLFYHGRLKGGIDFTSQQNLASRCLAHAIATYNDEFADWCGYMMLSGFDSRKGPYDRWLMPFEPFMVHLFSRWKKLPPPSPALPCASLGVYQILLDSWYDELEFAQAVADCCAYHAEHSIGGRVAHAEFIRIPHNVFPAEILAVKRLREEEGLPWPVVDHPLLKTPLAKVPQYLPDVRSPLLDRVAVAARDLMPELVFPI